MDLLAHGLWAGIGVAIGARRWPMLRRTAVGLVALAMAPDLAQLVPLIVVALTGHGGWASLAAYATASPIFYPFTQWGFDALAWNTPWFLVANHGTIVLVVAWLLWQRFVPRQP